MTMRMRRLLNACSLTVLGAPWAMISAATITLTAPVDYQVFQRSHVDLGRISIAGTLTEGDPASVQFEARFQVDGRLGEWQQLQTTVTGSDFQVLLDHAAGGWFQVEVRAVSDGKELAHATVAHVGIGEVFVVAGQSNSANHGAEKQMVMSGFVASSNGATWRIAHDPQAGASGGGGSFMPPLTAWRICRSVT